MIKNLTAIGNSLGVIIDKPILELLNITKDTLLDVRTDGDGLIIRPIRDAAAAAPPGLGTNVGAPAKSLSQTASPPPAAAPPATEPPAPNQAIGRGPPPPQGMSPQPETIDEPRGGKLSEAAAAAAALVEAAPKATEPTIVVEMKGEVVQRIPLGGRSQLTFGRDPSCEIHLDDRALSRRHCRIERRGAALWVLDLKSANGTLLNGQPVKEPCRLHGGDVIGVGRYTVRFEGVGEAKADTPVLTLNGPEGTHRFALVGEEIVLGRADTCDIAIGHKSISRRHLKIVVKDGGFQIEDLGSQNGTKVNSKRIAGPVHVTPGDKIVIGGFTVELGFLEGEKKSGHRGRTMLIDRRELAKTAYVDGEYENVHSHAGRLALGRTPRGNTKNNGTNSHLGEEGETEAAPGLARR